MAYHTLSAAAILRVAAYKAATCFYFPAISYFLGQAYHSGKGKSQNRYTLLYSEAPERTKPVHFPIKRSRGDCEQYHSNYSILLPSDTPREVIESGLYFRFGPPGTTFSQDVMITMDFDPELFEGRTPVIYTYTSEGGWIALETTVDWESSRATAYISHFSLYALFETDSEPVKEISFEPALEDTEQALVEEAPVEESTDGNEFGFVPWVVGTVFVIGLRLIYAIRKRITRGFKPFLFSCELSLYNLQYFHHAYNINIYLQNND
jgi:hypothetical protein